MKKLILTALALLITAPALADNRLRPNISVQELPELPQVSVESGDYVLGFDTDGNDWKKIPADILGTVSNSEIVDEANTITTTECGSTFFLNDTTEFASTLPDPAQGCKLDFIVTGAPSGDDYTIVTTGAETIKGLGFESETDTGDDGPTTAAADTITFVDGVAAAGDRLGLISDGTSWLAVSFTSSDGGITFSSAI